MPNSFPFYCNFVLENAGTKIDLDVNLSEGQLLQFILSAYDENIISLLTEVCCDNAKVSEAVCKFLNEEC